MSASGAKPNIVFYCGSGLGLGHLFRCRMLLDGIAGTGSTLAVKPGPDVERFLASSPVPCQMVEPHMAGGGLGLKLADIAGEANASVVLLDCKDNSRELVLTLRQCGLSVVTLEDLGPGRLEADLLLDPHIHPGSPEAVCGGRAECCFGPGWALLAPAFVRLREKVSAGKVECSPLGVVVSLGGSDPAGLTGRVLEALATVERELRIDVVIGPAAHADELPLVTNHALRVHRSLPDLADLLSCADISFVGGGITMFESVCLGAATVVVPQHEEQHRNAARMEALGAVRLAPPPDVSGAETELRKIITGICGRPEARRSLREAGMPLVDGRAAERLAGKINLMVERSERGKLAPARR